MAAMAASLRVDTAVVLQGEKVRVGLEAHGAVVDADSVSVLVVKEGAGVTVRSSALITSVQRQRRKGRRKGKEE